MNPNHLLPPREKSWCWPFVVASRKYPPINRWNRFCFCSVSLAMITSLDALWCGLIGSRSRPFPYGSELFLPITCEVPNRFNGKVSAMTRTAMMMMMMSFSFVLPWCQYNVEENSRLTEWSSVQRRTVFFSTLERAGNLRKGNTHYSTEPIRNEGMERDIFSGAFALRKSREMTSGTRNCHIWVIEGDRISG